MTNREIMNVCLDNFNTRWGFALIVANNIMSKHVIRWESATGGNVTSTLTQTALNTIIKGVQDEFTKYTDEFEISPITVSAYRKSRTVSLLQKGVTEHIIIKSDIF